MLYMYVTVCLKIIVCQSGRKRLTSPIILTVTVVLCVASYRLQSVHNISCDLDQMTGCHRKFQGLKATSGGLQTYHHPRKHCFFYCYRHLYHTIWSFFSEFWFPLDRQLLSPLCTSKKSYLIFSYPCEVNAILISDSSAVLMLLQCTVICGSTIVWLISSTTSIALKWHVTKYHMDPSKVKWWQMNPNKDPCNELWWVWDTHRRLPRIHLSCRSCLTILENVWGQTPGSSDKMSRENSCSPVIFSIKWPQGGGCGHLENVYPC